MFKLSENNIQELYKFTEQHYVEWYDVQTELVDHLANGIEAQYEENPSVNFEEALNKEFKKFGVLGFSEVVEEKTKALNKYYRRLVWQSFLNYFKLPKLLLTLVMVLVVWQILITSSLIMTLVIPIGFLAIFQFILFRYLIIKSRKNKRIEKQTGKKLLVNRTLLGLGDLLQIGNVFLFYLLCFTNIFANDWSFLENPVNKLILAFLMVALGIALYISIKVVPNKLIEIVLKQNPHYKHLFV